MLKSISLIITLIVAVAADNGEVLLEESTSKFANSLYNQLVLADANHENVVFSPTSVQTCLALAFFGAKGKTAEEMSQGLYLGTTEKQSVAKRFSDALHNSNNLEQVQIANKIYVQEGVNIKNDFNAVAKESFQSEAEVINFSDQDAVTKINSWVEQKTNNNIKNLVKSVTEDTVMMLVNAIHLKAKWEIPFSSSRTAKSSFYLTPENSVEVDMMKKSDAYIPYAELSDLDATGIEMAYKDSDLSMVIILPNKKDGLSEMEKKLQSVNLHDLSKEMKRTGTDIFLPKFTIESEFNLNKPLENMGMQTMFSNSADFKDLFEGASNVKITKVIHKAFIKVDEEGTEASAATYVEASRFSARLPSKQFIVDHPFFYFIRDANNIYFMGHVTKF